MKTLTATNQRVQFYLTYTTERPSTSAKRSRLNAFRLSLEERNIMLDEAFPNKQRDVLDHIIYITSAAGIAKVGADKLAERCGVSVRTVTSAVRALKESGEYIVARLIKSHGGAGKYVFVDKKHDNFREIMREVFSLSDYKLAQLNAEAIAEQNEPKTSSESLVQQGLEGEKQTPNLNISFISKQVKNKYVSEVASAVKEEIEKKEEPNREYIVEYASNPYQIAFYDVLNSMPYQNSIKSVQHVLALRIGSDCDAKRFSKAKDIIHSIAMQLSDGYVFKNIVSTFTAALEKAVQYEVIAPVPTDKRTAQTPKVPFYNWLKERD